MLHEPAVSWTRLRLTQTLPKRSWEETTEAYYRRLRTCAAYINEHYDVRGLRNELPARVAELERRRGDRLGK